MLALSSPPIFERSSSLPPLPSAAETCIRSPLSAIQVARDPSGAQLISAGASPVRLGPPKISFTVQGLVADCAWLREKAESRRRTAGRARRKETPGVQDFSPNCPLVGLGVQTEQGERALYRAKCSRRAVFRADVAGLCAPACVEHGHAAFGQDVVLRGRGQLLLRLSGAQVQVSVQRIYAENVV